MLRALWLSKGVNYCLSCILSMCLQVTVSSNNEFVQTTSKLQPNSLVPAEGVELKCDALRHPWSVVGALENRYKQVTRTLKSKLSIFLISRTI